MCRARVSSYREGASHPANEIAVANGQVDLAIDYDSNLNAMMERGLIKADQVKIVWTSDPLPNERGWPAPSPCSGAA